MVDGYDVLAVSGLMFAENHWFAYADIPEPARVHKRAIVEAIREMRALMEQCRIPVIAWRDPDEDTAHEFLAHIGFVEDGEDWRYERERA